MTIRDDNQSLETPIEQLLNGINGFDLAVRQRILDGEWTDEHIKTISDMRTRLNALEIELSRLKRETW